METFESGWSGKAKKQAETQSQRPDNERDKSILAAGTECPKVPKSRDKTIQHMSSKVQMCWSRGCEARSVGG